MVLGSVHDGDFSLRFSLDEQGEPRIVTTGAVTRSGDDYELRYGPNRHILASSAVGRPGDSDVFTFHRNMIPLYARQSSDAVVISNAPSALIDDGETLRVDRLTLMRATRKRCTTVFDNLFVDISLLLPGSRYRVEHGPQGPSIRYAGVDLAARPSMTREDFLEYFIERTRIATSAWGEIALGITGGYDSRFEAAVLGSLGKRVLPFHYTSTPREIRAVRAIAAELGAPLSLHPYDDVSERGWDLLYSSGYNARWDGFFAIGLPPSIGLADRALTRHPGAGLYFLNNEQLKGRCFQDFDLAARWRPNVLVTPLPGYETGFEARIEEENAHRTAVVHRVVESATGLGTGDQRSDGPPTSHRLAVEATYTAFYQSAARSPSRAAIFYEHGSPVISGEREVRERFCAVPEDETVDSRFLEWAVTRLAPRLGSIPYISSSSHRIERQFGAVARSRRARRLLRRWAAPGIMDALDWLDHPDVREAAGAHRPVHTAVEAAAGKGRMAVAAIVRLLAALERDRAVRLEFCDPDPSDRRIYAVR